MSTVVNMLEAKTSLSELVRQVESGACNEIIIARSGRPAARLVPLRAMMISVQAPDSTWRTSSDSDVLASSMLTTVDMLSDPGQG